MSGATVQLAINKVQPDWEGMAYAAIQAESDQLHDSGIGQVEAPYKDAYVILENERNGKACGAIVKTMAPGMRPCIDADPCLLNDISASPGSPLTISRLAPVAAVEIKVAISNPELNPCEIEGLCRTYLARQPLSPGQRKPIYLFTGEKIVLEIEGVQPHPYSIFSPNTRLVVDAGKTALTGDGLDEVGGLENEKRILRERILLPIRQPGFFAGHGIRPPRGILLCGPPGCGKTMIARALATEIDANFFELRCAEIFNSAYGESEKAINDLFKKAREKAPAIVLIDEIDAIGGARAEMKGELEKRLVTTLLTAMDGLKSLGHVIVIGTTNMPNALDPALRRPGRFDYEIHIGVPDRNGRLEILEKKTRRMAVSDDVDLGGLARRTHGFVGADLMLLCREAAFEALTATRPLDELLRGKAEPVSDLQISQRDFDNALTKVKPSALREFAVEIPTPIGWDQVGGLVEIKDTLIQEIIQVLHDPEAFEQVGIKPVRGVLFYGPPGTGKTLLARVIANEAEANFIAIKGPEVLSKWFGESEQRIRHLFQKARESNPCIVFFDEIDAITPARGNTVSDGADRVVNQLLTEMDGFDTSRQVCVIAATNRIDTLDPALLRPGRFDHQIHVPLPDERGLEEIYRIHTRNMPLANDVGFAVLAAASRLFSGAHVAEACRRAAMTAFREANYTAADTRVRMSHFMDAIGLVKKTVKDVEKPKIGFTAEL